MNHFQTAERLVKLLEGQFKIFGFKFGLDPIIGLAPGLGDLVGFGLGCYLIWTGTQMGISNAKLAHMTFNLLFDLVVGSIPVLGDVFDFFHKANSKNLEILRQHHVTRAAH